MPQDPSPPTNPQSPEPPPDGPPEVAPETATGRRLGRDAIIYGVGFILQRAAGFLMLPIYTRYLSPSDYGILHLIQMSLDVAAILLTAGVAAGVYRYFFKAQTPEERHGVVVAAWVLMLGFNVLGALALLLGAEALSERVFEDAGHADLIRIAAVSFLLEPCMSVPTLFMQVKQRSVLYTLASTSRLLVQLSLNIFFVVGLGAGVKGILLSTLIAYGLLSPVLLFWMFRRTGWPNLRPAIGPLFRFGLPYRVTDAGAFILTYADRYVLNETHGLAATGVYSLAYQFGFLIGYLGAVPFFMAWNPQRFQMVDQPREVRDAFYNRGFVALSVVMWTLAVGISLFVGPALIIMSAESFHGAAILVPLILVAYVLQSWTQVLEFNIQVSERTQFVTAGTWLAVGVVLVGYALLIPPFGGMGAAVATVLAFIARLLAFAYFAGRLWPVDYVWRPHLILAGYSLAVIGGFYALRPDGFWPQVGAACGALVVYAGVAWRGGALSAGQRASILEGVAAIWARVRSLFTRGRLTRGR